MSRIGQGVLAVALIFFSGLVAADGLAVNPIRLELEPGQRTGSLNITNDSNETKVLQVTAKRWTQQGDESVYEPATDVIATPVLFRIPPKSRQLVRVGFVQLPEQITEERTYRIYLTEVPEGEKTGNHVRFLLRLGIPLFLPPRDSHDQLAWHLLPQGEGILKLSVANKGNRHVRLQGIQLHDRQGMIAEHSSLDYLLSGSSRSWLLTPQRALTSSQAITVKAQSGRGLLESEIPLGAH